MVSKFEWKIAGPGSLFRMKEKTVSKRNLTNTIKNSDCLCIIMTCSTNAIERLWLHFFEAFSFMKKNNTHNRNEISFEVYIFWQLFNGHNFKCRAIIIHPVKEIIYSHTSHTHKNSLHICFLTIYNPHIHISRSVFNSFFLIICVMSLHWF